MPTKKSPEIDDKLAKATFLEAAGITDPSPYEAMDAEETALTVRTCL